MYYIDKILEIFIVLSLNFAFIFFGKLLYNLFRKDSSISISKVTIYFGIGAGTFGTVLFFLGATVGLGKATVLTFLSSFLIVSLLSFVRAMKDLRNFIHAVRTDKWSRAEKILFVVLILFILYNIYRGLWPDVDFDSTWYHLTEPKIYLMNEKISFIKGGLLYYSAMPELIETFYLLGLFLKSAITAKLFHTFFGIWCAVLAFVWGRQFGKSKFPGLIAALVFYASNLVFWESQNAYIDLGVTFFVSLGLWQFVSSLKNKISRLESLVLTSTFMGFALGTKLLSIYWVFILIFVNFFWLIITRNFKVKTFIMEMIILGGIPFLMWLPWGIYSYYYTQNPVYPLMEGLFNGNDWFSASQFEGLSKKEWLIKRITKLFRFPIAITYEDYGFSPVLIYGFFASIFLFLKKKSFVSISLVALIFIIAWNFTPASGGRFFLPVTLLMSVYAACFLSKLSLDYGRLTKIIVTTVILLNGFWQLGRNLIEFTPNTIVYSKETEEEYLKKNVSQNIWSFYDYDGAVKNLVGDSKVLVYNVHNLFYLDFDFDEALNVKTEIQELSGLGGYDYIKLNYDYIFIKLRTMGSDVTLKDFCNEVEIDLGRCTKNRFNLVYSDDYSSVKIYEVVK